MSNLKKWWDKIAETGELMLKTPPKKEDVHREDREKNDHEYDSWLQGLLAAVGGGMLGTILSGKGTSTIAKLGGGVAVAALAYRAYNNYCGNTGRPSLKESISEYFKRRSEERENSKEEDGYSINIHSKAMLMSIINLAKVDGQLTVDRRAKIIEELTPLISDQAMMEWMIDELDQPFNIQGLVQLAEGSPMIATEIYMVTIASAKHENILEEQYINDLKTALGIDQSLQSTIDHELELADIRPI